METCFGELVDLYTESHRFYHNLTHIEQVLTFFHQFSNKALANHDLKKTITVLAIFYHDCIYQPEFSNNEEMSNEKFKHHASLLQIPNEIIELTSQFILATKKHQVFNDDPWLKLFLDADLSILGTQEKEYNIYKKSIRKEYDFVPKFKYIFGRRKVLKKILERPQIYFSKQIRDQFEIQARINISKERRQLLYFG